MKNAVEEIENILLVYTEKLQTLAEEDYSSKLAPGKWSKKEILGHLADSAQNNLRRFIVSQYEDQPHIVYNQDQWVAINDYQRTSTADLVDFWVLLNKQICSVLRNTSPEMQQRRCVTNLAEPQTIQFLADDYIKHLLHHLHQVLSLEPVAYP